MFRLLKLLFWLAGLGAFVWFGSTVQLGNRTLFGHLRAIGQTKESQELWEGTKQKVSPVVDDVKKRVGHADGGAPEGAQARPAKPQRQAKQPQDQLTDQDREQLRKAIGVAKEHVTIK